MKILATSDLHSYTIDEEEMSEADVLVLAGDLTFAHKYDYNQQLKTLTKYDRWLATIRDRYKHIIMIAGNHDMVFEFNPALVARYTSRDGDPWHYLENESIELDGVRFWGSPVTPPFCSWGFNREQAEREEIFASIPDSTDVVITHGPPVVGTLHLNLEGDSCGCEILTNHLLRVAPKIHISGHIHEGYGMSMLRNTACYNVSVVNRDYRPVNPPVLIEI